MPSPTMCPSCKFFGDEAPLGFSPAVHICLSEPIDPIILSNDTLTYSSKRTQDNRPICKNFQQISGAEV